MDPNDRRGLNISLSDAGFALADELIASHVKAKEHMLSSLAEGERSSLRSQLAKIGNHL